MPLRTHTWRLFSLQYSTGMQVSTLSISMGTPFFLFVFLLPFSLELVDPATLR